MKDKKKKNMKVVPQKKVVKKEKVGEEKPATEKGKKTFAVLRGMHDILPKEERYWKKAYHVAEDIAAHFQFGRIETPLLEEANLFVRSIGKGTDVVDKEMYLFEDRDGSKVCMRPEATAGIMRAYISNGLWNLPQPIKVWCWGQMFRHDRPQAGRYRQFHQVDFETIGSNDPSMDAEMILVGYNFYKDLGLPVTVNINSLGTPDERQRYKVELVNYYRSKRGYLCEDCKLRLTKNPLRLLDCKVEGCLTVKEDAPQIVDWLTAESKNHFMKVLEYLDVLSIPYQLTPSLVRGLDYYTHTVFEFYPEVTGEEGAQSALGGGGRYDLLAEELGGRPTPACGMGIGIERALAAVRQNLEKNGTDIPKERPEVFLAQLGEEARRVSLRMIDQLRHSGIRVGYNLSKGSLKAQMELADAAKVSHSVIIGQKEMQDGTVIVRDMESGVQEIVDQKKLDVLLKKKLGKV